MHPAITAIVGSAALLGIGAGFMPALNHIAPDRSARNTELCQPIGSLAVTSWEAKQGGVPFNTALAMTAGQTASGPIAPLIRNAILAGYLANTREAARAGGVAECIIFRPAPDLASR